jgi:hypothetical protein
VQQSVVSLTSVLKGTVSQDFRPSDIFHQTIHPRALIHELKPFRISAGVENLMTLSLSAEPSVVSALACILKCNHQWSALTSVLKQNHLYSQLWPVCSSGTIYSTVQYTVVSTLTCVLSVPSSVLSWLLSVLSSFIFVLLSSSSFDRFR